MLRCIVLGVSVSRTVLHSNSALKSRARKSPTGAKKREHFASNQKPWGSRESLRVRNTQYTPATNNLTHANVHSPYSTDSFLFYALFLCKRRRGSCRFSIVCRDSDAADQSRCHPSVRQCKLTTQKSRRRHKSDAREYIYLYAPRSIHRMYLYQLPLAYPTHCIIFGHYVYFLSYSYICNSLIVLC